jgi:hypothetical protein
MENFFAEQPKISSTSSPSKTVVMDEEPSSRFVNLWTDPQRKRTDNGEACLRKKGERARHQRVQSEANVFWAILFIFKLQEVEKI